MKKYYLIILLFILPTIICNSQIELGNKGQEYYYSNPVITGMNPDPSICRVGEDYYLVTSTFGFFPGLPIYHSRDLVHWKLIGYGVDRPSQLNLIESKADVLNLFAATIRYHKGVFYIINTNTGRRDDNRNFIITATNPAGPWSDAHYIEDAPRIDPSLFFDDDGKAYYTGNDISENPVFDKQRNIWTQEIDVNTWKLVGDKVVVVDPGENYKGLVLAGKENLLLDFFEGPHVYKKDGKYYLLISHGGTFWEHAVSIWKSDSIFGPFTLDNKNPIVTNRDFSHDSYLHHTGHADIVETQNGEWWMVLLATRPYGGDYTNLGRETCLVPLDWSGVWPVVNPLGPIGRVMPIHRRPNLPNYPWPDEPIRDNFDSKKLGLNWNFIQTPKEKWWNLEAPSGKLKINLRPEIIENTVNPSFIGRRQAHKSFTAITKMEFTSLSENEMAGMVITRDVSNHFQFVKTLKNGSQYLQLIRKEVVNDKSEKIIAETKVGSKAIYLKMEALEQLFTFSFSEDGKNWKILAKDEDGRLLSFGLGIGRFTGVFVGMYGTSNGKETSNSAFFDWFEYSGF
jgi:xylan 1,4-beta-xylosidase